MDNLGKISKEFMLPKDLITTDSPIEKNNQPFLTLEQRRAFLKLPLEERRRLLEQQASKMIEHYQQDKDWKEFLASDISDD